VPSNAFQPPDDLVDQLNEVQQQLEEQADEVANQPATIPDNAFTPPAEI